MTKIESHLQTATTFQSFFGPLTLQPGLNTDVNDKVWRNLKSANLDVQTMLKQGALVEHTD